MFGNPAKSEYISAVHQCRAEATCQLVNKLLDILISETRIENDTVLDSELKLNQGKIAGWRELKDYIERGLPGGGVG